MRGLAQRLRRLEVRCLPPKETEASRQYYTAVLAVARNRARLRGEPLPDEVAGLEWTHQMSDVGEIILAARQRWRTEEES